MLARDAQRVREQLGANGPPRPAHDAPPRRLLQRRRELERFRRIVQRVGESRRERLPKHEVAQHRVVHRLDEHVGEIERRNLRQRGRLRGAKRSESEERDAGELARETRGTPRLFARARQVDDRRIHERGAKGLLELLGRSLPAAVARADAERPRVQPLARARACRIEHHCGRRRIAAWQRDRAHRCAIAVTLVSAPRRRRAAARAEARAAGRWQHRLLSLLGGRVRRSSRARGASTLRAFAYEIAARASSYETHRQAVIPRRCCGFVVDCVVSMR